MILERHRLILCDIWGCVHDGVRVFPEAARLLATWRTEGRIVLLITNAPRPAGSVQAQLDQLGLGRASYDAIVTSGDTGLAALRAEGRIEVGFIGTASDRAVLEAAGLILLPGPEGDVVVCTGLPDGTSDPAEQDESLRAMLARGARLDCFNPDRLIHRGGVPEACAGAIADRYEAIGGTVAWYGKPHAPIYDRSLDMASELIGRPVSRDETVAVGDSLATDLVGAAQAGFGFIFVTHGIESEQVDAFGPMELILNFAEQRRLHLPTLTVVVSKLG